MPEMPLDWSRPCSCFNRVGGTHTRLPAKRTPGPNFWSLVVPVAPLRAVGLHVNQNRDLAVSWATWLKSQFPVHFAEIQPPAFCGFHASQWPKRTHGHEFWLSLVLVAQFWAVGLIVDQNRDLAISWFMWLKLQFRGLGTWGV